MPFDAAAAALAVQLPARDTVTMVVARDGLSTAAAISTLVIGAFFLLLIPLLLLLIVQVQKVSRTVQELGEQGLRRADPLLDRGRSIADNVEFISMAVRTDVESITTSMQSVADRLQDASDHMEVRISDFNALMEVVQSEAEDLFVGTAATVRGVRAGARALRTGPPSAEESANAPEVGRPPPLAGDGVDGENGEAGDVYLTRPTGP